MNTLLSSNTMYHELRLPSSGKTEMLSSTMNALYTGAKKGDTPHRKKNLILFRNIRTSLHFNNDFVFLVNMCHTQINKALNS